jgi:hypothetical protein
MSKWTSNAVTGNLGSWYLQSVAVTETGPSDIANCCSEKRLSLSSPIESKFRHATA